MAEFDLLISRFDELDKRVEARFQALSSRFDDVNLRLTDVVSRLGTIETRLTSTDTRLDLDPRRNSGRSPQAMAISHTFSVIDVRRLGSCHSKVDVEPVIFSPHEESEVVVDTSDRWGGGGEPSAGYQSPPRPLIGGQQPVDVEAVIAAPHEERQVAIHDGSSGGGGGDPPTGYQGPVN